MNDTISARTSGSITIGGDIAVNRLGFGTMQLPGPGVWGPPTDHDAALAVLRRAVELDINFIDTADSYGPYVAENLIAEALYPYPENLVIATKAGLTRFGPIDGKPWPRLGRPEYLRQEAEMSLRRLRLDRIDLFQLHRIDPQVPFDDQVGELKMLRDEGKIRHIGMSGVSVEELQAAEAIVPIVSVQNQFNLVDRSAEAVLDYVSTRGIAFIPFRPLSVGARSRGQASLEAIAATYSATPTQLALAWLLRRAKNMLPIPGTSQVAHLEQNVAALGIQISPTDYAALDSLQLK